MPRCYMLAVAQGSALDSSSNNFTLFSLVEEVQVEQFPAILPFEVHTYWKFALDELNVDFQLRLVVIPAAGNEVLSDAIPLRSATPRFRMRLAGIAIPAPGSYELRVEWRESESPQWTRDGVFWPLEVRSFTGTTQHVAESPAGAPPHG